MSFLDCVNAEEEFELCLPDGEVTVHGAVGASELINTAKSGSGSLPANCTALGSISTYPRFVGPHFLCVCFQTFLTF